MSTILTGILYDLVGPDTIFIIIGLCDLLLGITAITFSYMGWLKDTREDKRSSFEKDKVLDHRNDAEDGKCTR